MKGHKEFILANFNCVFGESENPEPMLNYFEKIVFPAFNLDNTIREHFFYEVRLDKYDTDKYYLYGKIIKNTVLEINSIYNEETKELKETNQRPASAPYSEFILLLENHRLIFSKNQKGSPKLSNFKQLMKSSLNKVIKNNNKSCESGYELPEINTFEVIELPKEESVKKIIDNLDKISKFSLKVVELNNDILDDDFFEKLLEQKEISGSRSIDHTFNSPENKNFVAEAIRKSMGLMKFNLSAKDKNGESRNYTNNEFKEKMIIDLPEHASEHENEVTVIREAILDPRMNKVSKENRTAYDRVLSYLRTFFDVTE